MNFPSESASSIMRTVNIAFSAIFLLAYVIIITINGLFFYDCKSNSDVPWAAPYNYTDWFYNILKILLCLFLVFDFPDVFIVKNYMILIIAVLICIFRLLFPLFYNPVTFLTNLFFEAAFVISSVFILLYQNSIFKFSALVVVIQILTSIFLGFLLWSIIRLIQNFYMNKKVIVI